MKFNGEIYNDHIYDEDVDGSEEEEENEEDEDEDEDEDEGEDPDEDEDEVNDEDNNGDSQEGEDEDGDELEDDEDEPPDTAASKIGTAAVPKLKKSQGGNKKVVSKKQTDGMTAKKSKLAVSKLVIEAIKHLNERSGSSIVAIKRVILSNHPDMDERRLGMQIKRYVKVSLDNGTMAQIKRSFKITKKLDEEQKKMAKERQKARKEKLKEKAKQMKKDIKPDVKGKDKSDKAKKITSDDKEKAKSVKGPSPNVKGKPIKAKKVDEAASKASKGVNGKDQSTKDPSAKPKIKVRSRKSINLLVKHTPPRPKTMKKSKPVAGNEKPDLATKDAATGTSKSATAATGRGRKPKAV